MMSIASFRNFPIVKTVFIIILSVLGVPGSSEYLQVENGNGLCLQASRARQDT